MNDRSPLDRIVRLGLLCSAVFLIAGLQRVPVAAQEFDDDEPPEFLPGLVAEVVSSDGKLLSRLDSDLQFDWEQASVDPRLAPDGDFKIKWSGFLQCKENGEFRIHTFAAGAVRIRIDRQEVLSERASQAAWSSSPAIHLKFGRHELEVEYSTINAANVHRQFGLYWSGPQFELEPISQQHLSHRAADTVNSALGNAFERGGELSRALRCVACHNGNDVRKPLAAPALTHLDGNLNREWLIARLLATDSESESISESTQQMPHFGLSEREAAAITSTLFEASLPATKVSAYQKPKLPKAKKGEIPPRVEPSATEGRAAFLSLGCLACHQVGELGERSAFDGGDLSAVAKKRTKEFHARWLENPANVNRDHRMPVFSLQPLQREDLVLYLQSLGSTSDLVSGSAAKAVEAEQQRSNVALGKQLIARHRCAACHDLPGELKSDANRIAIRAESDWAGSCLRAADAERSKPGFALSEKDRAALQLFWSQVNRQSLARIDGKQLLVEHNCVKCHARDGGAGLSGTLNKLAKVETALAPKLAALAAPSLTGVGDKMHESALRTVIAGKTPARRPWLAIQMPKFNLSELESKAVIEHLVAHDRIPALPGVAPKLPVGKAVELAAARLVTAEGFGCQSCHKIGSAEPPKVAINAHGTDLTMLGEMIRPSWFRRWVRNPSRIVPRMEMPAIQVAVKGVLHDDLNLQLDALWETLNTPGFEPPRPNPVRVVRNYHAEGQKEHANVLTDVLETPAKKFLRPLIVGLPNRHNLLMDLESGRLTNWWIGDTARQYTRGKSWYWEAGAPAMVENVEYLQQFALVDATDRVWRPKTQEQFVVQFDALKHVEGGIEWHGRVELQYESVSRFAKVSQQVVADGEVGLMVTTRLEPAVLDSMRAVLIEMPPSVRPVREANTIRADLSENAVAMWSASQSLELESPNALKLTAAQSSAAFEWTLRLSSNLPPDRFQLPAVPTTVSPMVALDVVPGYSVTQLPLPRDEMPTAMAWRSSGEMFVASLKGRVLQVIDSDADSLGDRFKVISDDLPAPYGLAVNADSVDVLCKTSLIRLSRSASAEVQAPFDQQVVADGWGYTADYHDWAVGLQRDIDGGYFMALPCQQDDRSPAAAKLRGQALKLIPYQSADSPRAYRIESMAAGLRFPMGLALNRDGELFATDNQGNYNPFNELNHLRFGKRYGFINKLEAKPGFSPEFESPAVNLPHPWTRSVNGLCFLETPRALNDKSGPVFGPFEGDLIGCEYNGLSLIRMSLQKVNGQMQGAAYMFSRVPASEEATFEGPVCCAISPNGDVYVGSIHDSGWGGGQNTGSIVRLRADRELPMGIDEVRATATGLEVVFTQPVNAKLATNPSNYNVRSYRRVSTPAYGGDDQDERNEPIKRLSVSVDLKTVELQLNDLREGAVYEINVGSVGVDDAAIFPSQAHYNMRSVPQEQH